MLSGSTAAKLVGPSLSGLMENLRLAGAALLLALLFPGVADDAGAAGTLAAVLVLVLDCAGDRDGATSSYSFKIELSVSQTLTYSTAGREQSVMSVGSGGANRA